MKLVQTMTGDLGGGRVFYCGGRVTFTLTVSGTDGGRGFLRTTLGRGLLRDRETIASVESGLPAPGQDWHDLPMKPAGDGGWSLTLPLTETGFFEAKAGWRRDSDGRNFWPEGGNMEFKVEPASAVAANQIYTAFVRQCRTVSRSGEISRAASLLESEGYHVMPVSGTFREMRRRLDVIFGDMGMRILQLLPIHPVPEVYARMGNCGSPFAALDYFAVDPALAEFDRRTTVTDQFLELVDGVHAVGGRIFMDIPVNHTGWGSRLQEEHPEYFVRDADGAFVSPGAWGVVWEDLCKLDYSRIGVDRLMAEVFLFWCRRGIDGFRCDAGYMLPRRAWDYITARVRTEYPDTVFLLEGLGGPLDKQRELLLRDGLNWGYSELFQNYTIPEIREQFRLVTGGAKESGLLVNFSETHDNSRLAAKSRTWSRMRMALCALLSENGAFGFANGAEFFATEQIDVHGNTDIRWMAADNQLAEVRAINDVLSRHPAFHAGSSSVWIDDWQNAVVKISRRAPGGERVLVLVNTDTENPAKAVWMKDKFEITGGMTDLLHCGGTGGFTDRGDHQECELSPGGFAVFGLPGDLTGDRCGTPAAVARQELLALAQKCWCCWNDPAETPLPPPEELLRDMESGFMVFAERRSGSNPPPVTLWRVPADRRRTVVLPPGDTLCLESDRPFAAALVTGDGRTVAAGRGAACASGGKFIWACRPPDAADRNTFLTLRGAVFTDSAAEKFTGTILQPPPEGEKLPGLRLPGAQVTGRMYFFGANRFGGMAQIRARWGEIASKYDCWIGANCSREFPMDRRVMFSRLRGWVVTESYSAELNHAAMTDFAAGENTGVWQFGLAAGGGRRVGLTVKVSFSRDSDAVRAEFTRDDSDTVDSGTPVKVILRPDVDDRINHHVTKAFTGPEKSFPAAVRPGERGFAFQPGGNRLTVTADRGRFVPEPEWKYMAPLPDDERYGLDGSTDIFSPGYFEFTLPADGRAVLTAVVSAADADAAPREDFPAVEVSDAEITQTEAARRALPAFLVRRSGRASVIAGYPWFLDWGRDTFIALRGLIAGGYTADAADVILQFASFEERGTIPNMIRGGDVSNRDTSDAPLWLAVAAADLIRALGDDAILREKTANGRTLIDVLRSIVHHYRTGTPNGIAADPESLLIYSPPHFTWMDTNYPAASPREGYPVEIQALWFAANEFLGSRGYDDCAGDAATIARSILRYFTINGPAGLSDCLHARPGVPASRAVPDNALRPNQLFAVTLGAVTAPGLCRRIVDSASELIVPGAIRSLSDRRVSPPLPVYNHGRLRNNPDYPYIGVYAGNEDDSRKPAYHNGTAWCWPFPSWVEAALKISDRSPATVRRLRSILCAGSGRWLEGAVGSLPEVADGDAPHRWGGCGAQAWSVTEFYRVARMLACE